jgi:hypothetical protein
MTLVQLDQKVISFTVAHAAVKHTLSGKITEYLFHAPVNGVTVSSGGSSVVSDSSGNYSINLPAGNNTLVVSSPYFIQRTISVNMQAMNCIQDIIMYTNYEQFIDLSFAYYCPSSLTTITEITGTMSLQSISGTRHMRNAGVELDLTLRYNNDIKLVSEIVCWGNTTTASYVGFIVYKTDPSGSVLSYAKRIPTPLVGEIIDYHWYLLTDGHQKIVLTSRTRGVLMDVTYPETTGLLVSRIETLAHYLEYNWGVEGPYPPAHNLYMVGNHSISQVYDKTTGAWYAPGIVFRLPTVTDKKDYNDILHIAFNNAGGAFNIIGNVNDQGVLP